MLFLQNMKKKTIISKTEMKNNQYIGGEMTKRSTSLAYPPKKITYTLNFGTIKNQIKNNYYYYYYYYYYYMNACCILAGSGKSSFILYFFHAEYANRYVLVMIPDY